jgi:uncharacterized protein
MAVDYFKIIHKHIPPDSPAYRFYLPHVILVTAKALKIAHSLHLSAEQIQFIEEAAMLHDIGTIKTNDPAIGCFGTLPYIQHGIAGKEILEAEGLPRHAAAVERHFGVGITLEDIEIHDLPLPKQAILPQTVEERTISFADIFFTKRQGSVWEERTIAQARASLTKINPKKGAIFDAWCDEFLAPASHPETYALS